VLEVARDLRQRKAERPILVAFVQDNGPEFSSATRADIERVLRDAGASLWTIVLERGSLNLNSREWQERAHVMHDLAAASGGRTRPILSDLAIGPAFTWVASMLTTQVRVTYARPEALVPPSRISVETRRPNLRVTGTQWAVR
jgi:hypothetical protein